MRRTTITTAAASLAVAATLALTGCGPEDNASPASPDVAASPAEVREAFTALSETSSLSMDFSLDASDQVKDKLIEDAEPQAAPILDSVLDGSFSSTITLTDGQTFAEYAKEASATEEPSTENVTFAFAFSTAETSVLDVRFVDDALFIGADTDKISEIVGIDVEQYLLPMVAGSPAEPAVQALIDGQHLSVSAEVLKEATGGVADEISPTEEALNPEEFDALVDALGDAFDDSATVAEGTDGATVVTVASEKFVNALFDAAEATPALAAELDQSEREAALEVAKERPTVTVEVTIVDGKVAELVVPLAQFLEEEDKAKLAVSGEGRFALVLSFDTGKPVEAPADVFSIDEIVTTLSSGGDF